MNFIQRALNALRALIDARYRAEQEIRRAFNTDALRRHPEALQELTRIKQAEAQAKAILPAVIDAVTNPQDTAAERRYGSALNRTGAQASTGAEKQGAGVVQRLLNALQAPQRGAVAWTAQIAGPGSKYGSGTEAWIDDAEWGALLENYFPQWNVWLRRGLAVPMDLVLDPAIALNMIKPAVLARRAAYQRWLEQLDPVRRAIALDIARQKEKSSALLKLHEYTQARLQQLLNPQQYAIADATRLGESVSLLDVLSRKEPLARYLAQYTGTLKHLRAMPGYVRAAAEMLENKHPVADVILTDLPEGVREIIEKAPDWLAHPNALQLLKPEERQALGEALARISLRSAPQVGDVKDLVDRIVATLADDLLHRQPIRLAGSNRVYIRDAMSKREYLLALDRLQRAVASLNPEQVSIASGRLDRRLIGMLEILRRRRQEPVSRWDEMAARARERLDTPVAENALSVLSRFLTGEPLRETFAWQRVQVDDLPERVEWIAKKSPLPYTDILWHTISGLGQGIQNTPYRFIQLIRALNQLIR